MTTLIFLAAFCAAAAVFGFDAERNENFDESKVIPYTLPDPLICSDGTPVTTPELWHQKRRGEILELFATQMYGVMPECDRSKLRWETRRVNPAALGGKAVFKEVRVLFNAPNPYPKIDILICVPRSAEKPVPAFLGLNFNGNHTVSDDPWISPPDNNEGNHVRGKDPQSQRGTMKHRWPIETIIDRGYALITGYYEDIDPDFDDKRQNGVHPLFAPFETEVPESSRAATFTAWGWGLSRILDCLEEMPEIDAGRVALLGHSRLGKTALWTGANDTRFAMVISNDSGCGGAALSRRSFGETPKLLVTVRPHWFCPCFTRYAEDPGEIPFDQHELIALIAPRPVYIASADDDLPADPKGEYLAARNADPVYRLLGTDGIGGASDAPPETDVPVGATIHYHRRSGKHDLTSYDWEQYLSFADMYMKR